MAIVTAQEVRQRLEDAGFTPEQAAGMTGNFQHESNFDTEAWNAPEGAYGLMQVRGPRLEGLREYAASQGLPISDLGVQIGNVRRESQGPEAANYARGLSGDTPGQIARDFRQFVERAAPGTDDQRVRYANAAYGGGAPQMMQAGGATNRNVFGAPDPELPYEVTPRNPNAATEPGTLLNPWDDALTRPQRESQDPYQSAGAEFGDKALRLLNPLNLIGTALSLPTIVGAGMRNTMRGAMGLPSDYENLRSKGDLLEQALIENGIQPPRHGYDEPEPFGRGSSPITDTLSGLFGHSLSEHGREQERIRNLENFYRLTGIRSRLDRQGATDEYREKMLALAEGRYEMTADKFGWERGNRWASTPQVGGQFPGASPKQFPGLQQGAARVDQGERRTDIAEADQTHQVQNYPATDPILTPGPNQGYTPKAASEEEAKAYAAARRPLQLIIEAQNEAAGSVSNNFKQLFNFGQSPDEFSTNAELIDKTTLSKYPGRGKIWWYKKPGGGSSDDPKYREYGITTIPPEGLKPPPKDSDAGQAGVDAADPAAAAAVGGMVRGRPAAEPPTERPFSADSGPNLPAENQPDLRQRQAAQKAQARALAKDQTERDAERGKSHPWDKLSGPEQERRTLDAMNHLFGRK